MTRSDVVDPYLYPYHRDGMGIKNPFISKPSLDLARKEDTALHKSEVSTYIHVASSKNLPCCVEMLRFQVTILDFNWRVSTDNVAPGEVKALENGGIKRVKCYRNVILTWLFHTPVLLNWIDDKHRKDVCRSSAPLGICDICYFRGLARRFWSKNRNQDPTFDQDVDRFWRRAMPNRAWEWEEQNDAEEYMELLLQYLDEHLYQTSGLKLTEMFISPSNYQFILCPDCSSIKPLEQETPMHLTGKTPSGNSSTFSLEQSLKQYRNEEAFESRPCETCNGTSTIHEKSRPLKFAPPILSIQIQPFFFPGGTRFSYGSLSKLEPSMAFSSYTSESPGKSPDPSTLKWSFYNLYGVILRSGMTADGGHYVGAFKQRNEEWMFFDDVASPNSESISLEAIQNKQNEGWKIFMLFYWRLFQVSTKDMSSAIPSSVHGLAHETSNMPRPSPPPPPPIPSSGSQPQPEQGPGRATRRTKRPREACEFESESECRDGEGPVMTRRAKR